MQGSAYFFHMGVLSESDAPLECPLCGARPEDEGVTGRVLQGPFTRYAQRRDTLYFDLVGKYLKCVHCGGEVEVIDFQVQVDRIAATLPPADARAFSMKMMRLYYSNPPKAVAVLSILAGDFEEYSLEEDRYLQALEELTQVLSEP